MRDPGYTPGSATLLQREYVAFENIHFVIFCRVGGGGVLFCFLNFHSESLSPSVRATVTYKNILTSTTSEQK
jgi:hypothetical protein